MSETIDPAGEVGDDLELARRELGDAEREIAAIETALASLADGSFGRCEICGAAIGDDVLAAHFDARRCTSHAG